MAGVSRRRVRYNKPLTSPIVGFVQEYKAERALESLKRMASPQATVFRDGDVELIATETVVPGDIVLLEEGDSGARCA